MALKKPIDKKNDNQGADNQGTDNRNRISKYDALSTIADHNGKSSADQACIVYKFQSRPPYEGFILILVIIVLSIILLWWLNGKLKASKQ
jgi:hypothetical protein